jgi:hypothetical protein
MLAALIGEVAAQTGEGMAVVIADLFAAIAVFGSEGASEPR